MYIYEQLFPSFAARFVRRRKIYTQNSPESSFGRRRSNLTPFYLTCILQNPLISDTSLLARASERPFFCAPTISLGGARDIDLPLGTSPLVPSAAKHECRSRGAKLFLPFRLLFCSEVCKCFAACEERQHTSPQPAASALPTHTHRHHTSLVVREFSHSPSTTPADTADRAEMLPLGDLHPPPQGRHVEQLPPPPHAFPP